MGGQRLFHPALERDVRGHLPRFPAALERRLDVGLGERIWERGRERDVIIDISH